MGMLTDAASDQRQQAGGSATGNATSRLRSEAQPLIALRVLVGARKRVLLGRKCVFAQHDAPARPADRERLVLDDGLQPRQELVLARGRRLRQQDLDATLVGVLSVLNRRRVAAGGREQ